VARAAALIPTASVYATATLEAGGGVPPNIIFAAFVIGLAATGYLIARNVPATEDVATARSLGTRET
jgi:hypothetical protein